jgi:hypothetical protein
VQKSVVCAGFAACVAAVSWAPPSLAEGAIAIGLPTDIARLGFASGVSVNRASYEVARSTAVASCQAAAGATLDARRLCTVVITGRNQCFSIALDPMDGTPGVGWSIAESAMAAQQQAVALCQATSGPARAQFCRVADTQCDGEAR